MHSQALHFLNTLTVIALSATSITAMGPMPSSSVPGECQTVCDPIVKLMATCDMKPMRRDSANDPSLSRRESPSDQGMKMDSDCICKNTSFDVKSMTGMCASCMGQNQKTADKMAMEGMASEGFLDTFMLAQDVDRAMAQCDFPSASYAPSATSLVQGVPVQATLPVWTMTASNDTSRAGRVEVAVGAWGIGVLTAGIGLGAGLVVGML